MALTHGSRLGPYEVITLLGVGGMGEVFRAHDTKLNRDVALKVLPDSLANDRDRFARFTREAQTLAALNHPNIAHVHGLEESGGVRALVMELVEGEDLSTLIARGLPEGESARLSLRGGASAAGPGGPRGQAEAERGSASAEAQRSRPARESLQPTAPGVGPRRTERSGAPRGLSIDDALSIARQIADALEAAHEQGIVHRDLKPANIKVRADGAVKVLDFGLAKAMDPAGTSGTTSSALANSPTMTSPATQMGMILGTAAYMAPEQARGRAVDRRADIWSFGVVLYEMLTGRRAFEGEEISDVLAAVLRQDIDWAALPATTPPRLRRLLERCLDRDVKTRLRDIGEARIEIARIEAGTPGSLVAAAPPPAPAAPPSRWSRLLPWTAAGLLGTGLAVALFQWAPWRGTPVPTPRTLLASIGAEATLPVTAGASAILSPDGTLLAFVAQPPGQQVGLFVRKLDQLQATPLAGTSGAASPFFSPNGQWLAFFADGQLKKVSVTGGAAVKLSDAPNGRGGTWTDDDTIIFTPESGNGPNTRLKRVPSAGGAPADFVSFSEGAVTQRWPQALPGGTGVLYTEHATPDNWDEATLVVAPLSGETPKVVLRGGYYGRYVSAPPAGGPGQRVLSEGGLGRRSRGEGGFLLYMKQGTLFAVRFDLDRLETVGPAVPVLDGVATSAFVTGGTQLALSTDGTLLYVPGGSGWANYAIDWITRDGSTLPLRAARTNWSNPRFSPDGQKLAIEISDGRQYDIWVHDFARDTLTQLTFDPGDDRAPVWTPDGQRITFTSDRAVADAYNLYWMSADGTGEVTRLTDSPVSHRPLSWHPNGRFFAFDTIADVMILPMEDHGTRGLTPGTPTTFLATPAFEAAPMFSPDGRWIAYLSGEGTGATDVYVRPFPGPGGPWRISTTSGTSPRWSLSKPELLFLKYLDPSPSRIMAAPYTVVGDSFRAETPYVWSPTSVDRQSLLNGAYDLHPDGTRIAAAAVPDEAGVVRDKVVFVFNFADHLSTIVPGAE